MFWLESCAAIGVCGEIFHLPSFFPSTNVYEIPALPGTRDTKIKLDMVPALTLQWRKQKIKQAIRNSVLGAHTVTSMFEVREGFPPLPPRERCLDWDLKSK